MLHIGEAYWLVIDAPYVQLKVWPLIVDGSVAILDVKEWALKDWLQKKMPNFHAQC